jgi:hypothetical protein
MMHVFVRRRLMQHPEWKFADWGMPISVGDATITLMASSFVPAVALKVMGFRPKKEEIMAMMHFWRYVGHIMGVQPTWYPKTIEDAYRFSYFVLTKGAHKAGQDGIDLCRSYVEMYSPKKDSKYGPLKKLKAMFDYKMQVGYVGFFVSPKTRKANGLPNPGLWRWHPIARFPLVFLWETLRRHIAVLDDFHDTIARRQRQRWLNKNLGARKAEYAAVSHFTR